jgi:hypothetical protein
VHLARASSLFVLTAPLLACAASAESGAAPLEGEPAAARVVVEEVLTSPPEGGDGPDTVRLAREDESGRAPIEGAAIGGVAFLGGSLVLRPDRTLEMVRPGGLGVGSVIDREVVVAWTAAHGPELVLVALDREGGRHEAAQGLGSIGAIAFDPATHGARRRVAFVGARNGGIAGVWATHLDGTGLSCLTNCELRAGQPLGDTWIPLPIAPLHFEGDTLIAIDEREARRFVLPETLR